MVGPGSDVLARTNDLELITRLDRELLPGDLPMAESTLDDSLWWVATAPDGSAVGYCGLYVGLTDAAWLVRAGVLPVARGKGLQRRMIAVRLRAARRLGYRRVCTYTHYQNLRSLRSLVRCGFVPYRAEDEVVYVARDLPRQ